MTREEMIAEIRKRRAAQAQPSQPSREQMIAEIRRRRSGGSNVEGGDSDEFGTLDRLKLSLSPNDGARIEELRKMRPDLQFTQQEDGNIVVTDQQGRSQLFNEDGFSTADLVDNAFDLGSGVVEKGLSALAGLAATPFTTPAGGVATGIATNAALGGASETLKQGLAKALFDSDVELDGSQIAANAGLNAATFGAGRALRPAARQLKTLGRDARKRALRGILGISEERLQRVGKNLGSEENIDNLLEGELNDRLRQLSDNVQNVGKDARRKASGEFIEALGEDSVPTQGIIQDLRAMKIEAAGGLEAAGDINSPQQLKEFVQNANISASQKNQLESIVKVQKDAGISEVVKSGKESVTLSLPESIGVREANTLKRRLGDMLENSSGKRATAKNSNVMQTSRSLLESTNNAINSVADTDARKNAAANFAKQSDFEQTANKMFRDARTTGRTLMNATPENPNAVFDVGVQRRIDKELGKRGVPTLKDTQGLIEDLVDFGIPDKDVNNVLTGILGDLGNAVGAGTTNSIGGGNILRRGGRGLANLVAGDRDKTLKRIFDVTSEEALQKRQADAVRNLDSFFDARAPLGTSSEKSLLSNIGNATRDAARLTGRPETILDLSGGRESADEKAEQMFESLKEADQQRRVRRFINAAPVGGFGPR